MFDGKPTQTGSHRYLPLATQLDHKFVGFLSLPTKHFGCPIAAYSPAFRRKKMPCRMEWISRIPFCFQKLRSVVPKKSPQNKRASCQWNAFLALKRFCKRFYKHLNIKKIVHCFLEGNCSLCRHISVCTSSQVCSVSAGNAPPATSSLTVLFCAATRHIQTERRNFLSQN